MVLARALEQRGRAARRRRARRGDAGPGADRRAARRASRRAKALAASRRLPFAPVDHLQGHVAANFLRDGDGPFEPPFVCLIASGGHTLLAHVTRARRLRACSARRSTTPPARRSTRARACSACGYPGGAALERLAADGRPRGLRAPRLARRSARGRRGARRRPSRDSLDFSFAGLKTALCTALRELSEDELRARARRSRRLLPGGDRRGASSIRAAPGARGDRARAASRSAAASPPTARCARACGELDVTLHVPPRALCTDNAAMIASAARFGEPLRYPDYLGLDAYAAANGRLRAA